MMELFGLSLIGYINILNERYFECHLNYPPERMELVKAQKTGLYLVICLFF